MTNVIPLPAMGSGRSPFDTICKTDERGEYWSGRELMPLMDYAQWVKFEEVIKKAKASLALVQGSDQAEHHFPIRESDGGRWGNQKITDYRLTRFGAYLTAMAGDDTKEAVAHARVYFAVKTREAETAKPQMSLPTHAEALRAWADELERRQAAEELAHRMDVQRAVAEAQKKALTAKTNELAEEIREAKPKVASFNQLMEATGAISMSQAAKILPIPFGRTGLYSLLREKGIIEKTSTAPYQKYIDREYFIMKAGTYEAGGGVQVIKYTPYVTAKGLEYIRRIVLGA